MYLLLEYLLLDDISIRITKLLLQILLNLRNSHHRRGLTLTTEVLLQESKVLDIGDVPVMISVDIDEDVLQHFGGWLDGDERQAVLDGLDELGFGHESLFAPAVGAQLVHALDGHLAEMLLQAEVGLN